MNSETKHELPRLPLECDVPVRVLRRRGAIASCSAKPNDPSSRSLRRGGISVTRDENSEVRLCFATGSLRPDAQLEGVLSRVEEALLAGLKTGEGQQRRTGRFLTLRPARRAQRHQHDSLQDRSMTDHGAYNDRQTMRILSRVGRWNFNTFVLDVTTGGRSLPTLLFHLFRHYGLMDTFRLDVIQVWKCFGMIEEGYHGANPYHNAVHATDVTQAMHCFLQESKIMEHMTPLEVMTSLLAAVAHDLDHPGVNQPFLIATSNHLAMLYRNSSVLENHHWRSALCCLSQSGMLNHLDRVQWEEVTFQIRSLILATDITRQHEFLSRLKHYMESRILDLKDEHYRHFILQIALKCADICNPCRPWDISSRWSRRVCEEFFRQGDVERRLNLPVTALCDRQNTSMAKIQSGFFRFVVAPLFEEWDLFLQTPLSSMLVDNLRRNQEKWDKLVAAEESAPVAVVTAADRSEVEAAPRLQRLESALDCLLSRRRHSVPLSVPPGCLAAEASKQLSTFTTSLSTIASHLTEDLFLGMSAFPAPKSRHSLIKQNTFPPPLSSRYVRLPPRPSAAAHAVEASPSSSSPSSHDDSSSKSGGTCSNDGCGSGVEDGDDLAECAPAACRPPNDQRGFLGFPVLWPQSQPPDDRYRPLLRLKSDSDLLRHNGKLPVAARVVTSLAEEEKENANPHSRSTAVAWRSAHRKGKSQGVGMFVPRLMGRRGSAPVGLLKEEVVNGLRGGSKFLEGSRRRDSAPVDLLQDQLVRLQLTLGKSLTKIRRGSLPSEIPLDSAAAALIIPEVLLPNAGPSEFLNTAFCRRRSMPADLVRPPPDLGRKPPSGHRGLSELFPSPGRSRSSSVVDSGSRSGANDWTTGLWPKWVRPQSFDDSFSDPFPTPEESTVTADSAALCYGSGNGVSLFRDSKRNGFPCRRRSSVPAEACLFASSSDDDRTSKLMVDIT